MKNIKGILLHGPSKLEFHNNLETVFNFVPQVDQLLVKLHYAQINPSDFYFTKGFYHGKKPYPVVPGFEAFGVIEEVGCSDNQGLVGKPCVVFCKEKDFGAYSTHTISNIKNAIILDELPNFETFEYAANPITAIGLLEHAKEKGAKSFIQNGASSSVGKILHFLNNQDNKLTSIDIVRNISHKEDLTDLGANEVIDSTHADYLKNLGEAIEKYKPTIAYDCLAGDHTGTIFNLLPPHSVHYVYGSLELKRCGGIDPTQVIFLDKEIKGFHLINTFLKDTDIRKYTEVINNVAKNFKQTQKVKVFTIENYKEAFDYYPTKKEKVLFKCN